MRYASARLKKAFSSEVTALTKRMKKDIAYSIIIIALERPKMNDGSAATANQVIRYGQGLIFGALDKRSPERYVHHSKVKRPWYSSSLSRSPSLSLPLLLCLSQSCHPSLALT
jgi:hypothetical protein